MELKETQPERLVQLQSLAAAQNADSENSIYKKFKSNFSGNILFGRRKLRLQKRRLSASSVSPISYFVVFFTPAQACDFHCSDTRVYTTASYWPKAASFTRNKEINHKKSSEGSLYVAAEEIVAADSAGNQGYGK